MDNYVKPRTHYIMTLNTQLARLKMRALYGLIAVTRKIDDIVALVDDGMISSAGAVTRTGGERERE
jgi:hypothetical protein